MAKGDEAVRRHPRKHGVFVESIPAILKDRREARRTTATIAAREAIGAETADDACIIIDRDPKMRRRFDEVFQANLHDS